MTSLPFSRKLAYGGCQENFDCRELPWSEWLERQQFRAADVTMELWDESNELRERFDAGRFSELAGIR